jgi:CheY-like chemotaxis protein
MDLNRKRIFLFQYAMRPYGGLNMKKILVVDDSEVLRNILTFNLKHAGYDVQEAINGKDAIDKIKKVRPDTICLDIMMPIMDGFTVLKILKDEGMDIPVIVLTAKGGEDDEQNALSLGARKVLTKPFSPKQLIDTVKSLVGE